MKKERILILAGSLLVFAITSGTLFPAINWLSDADIRLLYFLNTERVIALDPFWIWISTTSFYIAVLVPLALLLYSRQKDIPDLKRKSYLVMISWGASVIILNILKYMINRPRPFTVLNGIEKLSSGGSPSFPSGHTLEAFTVVFAVILLSAGPKWLRILLFLWALMVAYSRISLGVHYPSDVVAAIGLGMVIAGGIIIGTPSRLTGMESR